MQQLPINGVLPELCGALAASPSAVLSAPPGSGKTTVVPLELLHQPWLEGQSILLLEPRRLAARAAAMRMAELLGESVGECVGYRVRFDTKVSPRTRIEVVTEGILTRRLQQDPGLNGVGLVIFDEFHERSLQADLGLALCLDIQQGLREDLRLLVMSATLDTGVVSTLLGGAPVIIGEGQSYPIALHYLDAASRAEIWDATARGVRKALAEQSGDVLVFLPGSREIRRVEELLQPELQQAGIDLCPLYGDLSREAQDWAIRPHPDGRRRMVLATAIAETSLTIEGVTTVVDAGWSRLPRFAPNSGLTRLETLRLSRAAAEQRAGRAGRLGPGVCYRLWTAAEQERLRPQTPPEILDADLASLVLELAQWGVTEPARLRWINPPPVGALAQARELLQALDALDERGCITPAGSCMVSQAVHPRLAHMLTIAAERGQGEVAADLAALLSERDLLPRVSGEYRSVDIEERLRLLQLWREQGRGAARSAGIDSAACGRVDRASRQLRPRQEGRGAPLSIGILLASAYPDRIAKRRGADAQLYLLSSGRGARLPEGDPLGNSEYLVAAQLDAGQREGRIFLAAPLSLLELRAHQARHIAHRPVVRWDGRTQSVLAQDEERLGALLLSSRPLVDADPEQLADAMLEGVRQMGIECLPWNDAAREWQARLLSLRQWQPEGGWPDLSDEVLLQDLDAWLAPWLEGISRREHLQRLDLLAILRGQLDWRQQQALEELVPTHIQVPSGSRKRLQYGSGEPPVLAVRLQEMFGLAETPTVCQGRVAVMLHLLSPSQRPIQVTQDLRGFWDRTYAEVKRELKGRYPKHPWPDDPWVAPPTARAKPRPR
jgi:ATP-dependent helicase HrpB